MLLMEMQNVSVTKESSVDVLQKLKMESLCDLAIPLLGICPKELKLTPEMLAPPRSLKHHFTVAKGWKHLSVHPWING